MSVFGSRWLPKYPVPLALAVKPATRLPVIAVGVITDYEQAEAVVGTGDADLIALARGAFHDPRWPWHAAAALGGHVKAPDQYLRSQPRRFGICSRMRAEVPIGSPAQARQAPAGA